jgi:hypothetical protein
MKSKRILSPAELVLVRKLCRPAPFMPTSEERAILEEFKKEGIVKVHRDGSIEVTEHGADRAIESRYGPAA